MPSSFPPRHVPSSLSPLPSTATPPSFLPPHTPPTPPPRAGNSQHKLGTAAAGAVKRIHLDERIARAAARAGADLQEGFEVGKDVSFDAAKGLWTVKSVEVGGPVERK